MSADRQRLVGAIRRIVKGDPEVRKVLDAYANRGDQAGEAALGLSGGDAARICCDGSTSGNLNPGATTRTPDAEGAGQTGLDPNDPAKLTAGDGTLSGVTDCATGEPVCMDGSGFIPPEGWEDPSNPPVVESFKSGTYWRYSYVDPQFGAETGEQFCGDRGREFVSSGDGIGKCQEIDGPGFVNVYRYDCLEGTTIDACANPEPVKQESWPSDGCTNLAIKGGKVVGSKYDPENDGSYSAPKTSIQLCDNANGTSILYQPLPGGGFRTIEASAGSAVSGAVGYTYSSDGTLTGTITQAEWDATAP